MRARTRLKRLEAAAQRLAPRGDACSVYNTVTVDGVTLYTNYQGRFTAEECTQRAQGNDIGGRWVILDLDRAQARNPEP